MTEFDSKEELHFSWYLNELRNAGYINKWDKFENVNDPYPLTEGLAHKYIKPMKRVEDKELYQTILAPSVYTPDFKIWWTPKARGIFVTDLNIYSKEKITTPFICQDGISIVETKGTFDMGNMTRLANNNIKFVYQKFGVFINMIKVPTIFKNTFTPDRYLLTYKSFKARKINYGTKKKYIGPRTLSAFKNQIQK
jgi:hypothetical protein